MRDPVDLPTVPPRRLPRRLIGKRRPPPPRTPDAKLDDALADSFPASDPVSFLEPAPKDRSRDRGP